MELKVNQDNDKCEECGTCQMFCPVNAIWLE